MSSLDHIGTPKAHALRLLLPFFLDRDRVQEAGAALTALRHQAKRTWHCWATAPGVQGIYGQEALPSVSAFLFGGDHGGCSYLRVPDDTTDFWFKRGGDFRSDREPGAACPGGSAAETPDGPGPAGPHQRPQNFGVALGAPGIEVFVSPHGVGVLSLAFESKGPWDLLHLRELNYRLSQGRRYTSFPFHLPHKDQDPSPPPPADAPLAERLGRAGGAFRLTELTEFLLSPLGPLGLRPMQEQFAVYSATRFDAATDFSDPDLTAALRPFLAALTHVEEGTHPGTLRVTEQILNPRHWAAAGSLAAVHLVADQDPPHPYDEQRVPSVLHKYFVPFLLSLMQRVALQRLLADARQAAVTAGPGGDGSAERLRGLNRHALAYTVNGCFTEVSTREALNQYYDLVQTGLRVRDSLGAVQQALRDAQTMDDSRFQGDTLGKIGDLAESLESLVKEAAHSAQLVAHVQSKVEWLEVFFVSYYFTALMYYVNHNGSLFSHDYGVWTLVAAPLVSGLIAFLALRPDRLRHAGQEAGHQAQALRSPAAASAHRRKERTWGFLVLLIVLFGAWLGVGIVFFPKSDAAHTSGGHEAPADTAPAAAGHHSR